MTPHIAILSSSVRNGRQSHRVALYFRQFLEAAELASTTLIDLLELGFPLFDERLRYLSNPPAAVTEFARQIREADGVLIVTPEYNGSFPASLKNAVDLLYEEWHRKPVAIATVSSGPFGGTQVLTALQSTLWKMRAWTVPVMFPVPRVQDAFDEQGGATDPEATEKRARNFLSEMLWCIEANNRMRNTPA